jgi:pyrroloquinoline quinone biosynthesis protein B
VAVSPDGEHWALINASPDLSKQIEDLAAKRTGGSFVVKRNPFSAVILTSADLDHTLGLMMVREGERISVWAPDAVRCRVSEWLEPALRWHRGVVGKELGDEFEIDVAAGQVARGSTISLPSAEGKPSFALELDGGEGKTVLIASAVPVISRALDEAIRRASLVLFDGTFWSEQELATYKQNAPSAKEMGHVPVERSLPKLGMLARRKALYFHINNTNPMLDPSSLERRLVEEAGLALASEGQEFTV